MVELGFQSRQSNVKVHTLNHYVMLNKFPIGEPRSCLCSNSWPTQSAQILRGRSKIPLTGSNNTKFSTPSNHNSNKQVYTVYMTNNSIRNYNYVGEEAFYSLSSQESLVD